MALLRLHDIDVDVDVLAFFHCYKHTRFIPDQGFLEVALRCSVVAAHSTSILMDGLLVTRSAVLEANLDALRALVEEPLVDDPAMSALRIPQQLIARAGARRRDSLWHLSLRYTHEKSLLAMLPSPSWQTASYRLLAPQVSGMGCSLAAAAVRARPTSCRSAVCPVRKISSSVRRSVRLAHSPSA